MNEPLQSNQSERDPKQKTIVQIYIVFGVGLLLSLVPLMSAAFLSLFITIGVLIAAYVIRNDGPEGSLVENHMTFIIRTIWIGSLLSLVSISVASIYLFNVLNNQPLLPCIEHFLGMQTGASIPMTVMNPQGMMMVFGGCWTGYWAANLKSFLLAAFIAAAPILIYFIGRYFRGFNRARAGYRVANPKSWF